MITRGALGLGLMSLSMLGCSGGTGERSILFDTGVEMDGATIDAAVDSGTSDAREMDAGDSGPIDSGSDAVVLAANVVVEDQFLDLSTVIVVAQLAYGTESYVVTIRDHGGQVVASREFDRGAYVAESFVLSRPTVDGEVLDAELRATEDGLTPLAEGSFTITHTEETVAMRFNLTNDGSSSYRFVSVDPESLAPEGVIGTLDPAVTLYRGWRYEFRSATFESAHPFALRAGATMVSLSGTGGARDGSAESLIDWMDSGDSVQFTVNDAFGTAGIVGYRCVFHSAMAGVLNLDDAP